MTTQRNTIMPENAILRLRQQRLAVSTRLYRARGSKAVRCQGCLLPQQHCLCHTIKPQTASSQFCLIMFDTEPLKPSNTGRLIADILPSTHAFLWSRTHVSHSLLTTIGNPKYQPYVVFPAAYTPHERPIFDKLPINHKPAMFILLDGTWSEARKMFHKSPYLDNTPVLSLNISNLSGYQLRTAQHPNQHCTAEVAIALLQQANDEQAAEHLSLHFQHFRQQYLIGKPHHPVSQIATITTENK